MNGSENHSGDPMLILVWHEHQRVPATCYGDANAGKGNYKIEVHSTIEAMRVRKGERPDAIIYHHGGAAGGFGGVQA